MKRIILASLSVAALITLSWLAGHLLLASDCGADISDVEGEVKQSASSTITYIMTITNTGNTTDRFDLTISDEKGASCTPGAQLFGDEPDKYPIAFLDFLTGNPLDSI